MQFLTQLREEEGIWFASQTEKVSYPETGNEDSYLLEDKSYWFQHRNKCIKHLVDVYGNAGIFADIGGGNGYVSKGVQELGKETVLIEPGIKGCLNAKKRGIEKVICARLEDINWSPNELQNAGAFDVVEHIEDDTSFLEQIHQAMAPSGRLFLTVPSFQHLWSNDDVHAGHFRRYTEASMKELLEKTGFKVLYTNYLFSVLHFPIFLFRTLPSKMLKKKKVMGNGAEHGVNEGAMVKFIQKLLRKEFERFKSNKKNTWGSSLVVVAEKKTAR